MAPVTIFCCTIALFVHSLRLGKLFSYKEKFEDKIVTRSSPFEVSTSEIKTNKKTIFTQRKESRETKKRFRWQSRIESRLFARLDQVFFDRFVIAAKVRNKTQWR